MSADVYSAFVQAFATIVGAGVGAWGGATAAFRLAKDEADRVVKEQRVAAGNQAIFVLGRQLQWFENIKRQSRMDDVRDNAARHILLRPVVDYQVTETTLKLDPLNFLTISRESSEALFGALMADDWFQTARGVVGDRARMHREHLQTKLEKALLPQLTSFASLDQIEAELGPRLTADLKEATDAFYNYIDQGLVNHVNAGKALREALKTIFPGAKFLTFTVVAADATAGANSPQLAAAKANADPA